MRTIGIGSLVRFKNYGHTLSGVPPMFSAGNMLVVIDVKADGEVRCARADYDGQPIEEITDTLFIEELALVQGRCRHLPAACALSLVDRANNGRSGGDVCLRAFSTNRS
jgi:hypothetical protein